MVQDSNYENVIHRLIFHRKLVVIKYLKCMVGIDPLGVHNSIRVRINPQVPARIKNRTIGSCTGTKVQNELPVEQKPGLDVIVNIFFGYPLRANEPMIQLRRNRRVEEIHPFSDEDTNIICPLESKKFRKWNGK